MRKKTLIINVHADIRSGVCSLNICLESLSTSVLSVFSSEGSGPPNYSLLDNAISNSYTMGFSEWIIFRTGGQTWYSYFIPPKSV